MATEQENGVDKKPAPKAPSKKAAEPKVQTFAEIAKIGRESYNLAKKNTEEAKRKAEAEKLKT